MSLRLRLTLYFTGFLAVALVVAGSVVYVLTQRSLTESVERRIDQALADFENEGYQVGANGLPGDAHYLVSLYVNPLLEPADLRNGTIFDGRLYADLQRNGPTTDPEYIFNSLEDDTYELLFDTGNASTTLRLEDGRFLRVRAFRIPRNEISQFPGVVILGFPIARDILSQLRDNLVRTVLVSFLGFGLLVWLASKQMLLPLKRMTQAASRVSSADLSQRVPVARTRDELRELSETLNHMLGRLQESFDTQRRFTADASHELRTPVTAIAGHVNYLLRRTKTSPEQNDSLIVIKREAERMGKLVADLLELARADAGFRVDRRNMNIVEVAEAVHMEIAPVAGQATINVAPAQSVLMVRGDFDRLKQVMLNLIQNALNAGSTAITLALFEERGRVVVEIADNGPGIPHEAIPHLFERFYRVDEARSTRGNGSGLGLAIVKWVVDQHEGNVLVESHAGEGTVFTIYIPGLEVEEEMPVLVSV
ncbi:MAG: ATP-binding protein [Deinococcota bacterium]